MVGGAYDQQLMHSSALCASEVVVMSARGPLSSLLNWVEQSSNQTFVRGLIILVSVVVMTCWLWHAGYDIRGKIRNEREWIGSLGCDLELGSASVSLGCTYGLFELVFNYANDTLNRTPTPTLGYNCPSVLFYGYQVPVNILANFIQFCLDAVCRLSGTEIKANYNTKIHQHSEGNLNTKHTSDRLLVTSLIQTHIREH